MKKRTWNIIFIALAFTITLLSVAYVFFIKKLTPKLNCTAYFYQKYSDSTYLLSASYTFTFRPDGSGIISADGNVRYENRTYRLRREAAVTMKPADSGIWQFTNIRETRTVGDNTPDEIYSRFFYDRDKKSGRYISIKKLDEEHWIIGSLRYPAFLCKNSG